ncbi:hypothetical protein VP01_2043g3 [Puccinia sorghi]|uniref:Uncharacterized protein n=1 Tax=Puccinia sorghi TaxID=27349 RepID=A0A0L6VCQ5_9BASI|nr:hypothetical protein VP01_2043g3 [Puccinia sorghi]
MTELPWRSCVFTEIGQNINALKIKRAQDLAGRKFSSVQFLDTHRQASDIIKKNPKKPAGLLADCYDEGYLQSLNAQRCCDLHMNSAIGLADILFRLSSSWASYID